MNDNTDKKQVQVFTRPERPGALKMAADPSSCGCSCSCGPDDAPTLDEMLATMSDAHGGEVDLWVAPYGSAQERDESMAALNRVLEQSGQSLRINGDNLDMVMSQAAPIIAVDGRIVCMAAVPTAGQLMTAVRTGAPVPLAPACC